MRWAVAFNLAVGVVGVVLCLALVVAGAALDGYTGRGGRWEENVATPRSITRGLGINTFLHFEVERVKVDRTARMLREAGISYARQQFPWDEIEPRPGLFVDQRTGRSSWEKYDYLVEALTREGVQVLARVENTPAWARPGEDVSAHPAGPPADYDRYAAFVGQLARRYAGKVTAIQVWNEPNFKTEWGGRDPNPVAYTDLLRRTHAAVKAAEPTTLVVAAGLGPTDGFLPGFENDLIFLEGMYAAGAKGTFDAMGVMIYGLGQSPDNRHVGRRFPINFSRPVLTREVMERHDDGGTPIWAAEYGWVAVPPEWTGRPSTWGESVSEELQAQYLLRGLERARQEWPWMGVICVWAFRFVEETMDPADPQRHFAIVRGDFSPRPAYLALASRAERDAATPGAYAITAPVLRFAGPWETQTLGKRTYRLARGADARLSVTFFGDQVSVLARQSVDGGRLLVTVDGRPAPGLPVSGGQAVRGLEASRTSDSEVVVASGLAPGWHTLEIIAGPDGEVALAGVTVARARPYGWALLWLHGAALLGLALALRALLRPLLLLGGYLPTTRAPGRWARHDWR